MRKAPLPALLLALILGACSCALAPVPIGKITKNPERFENRMVTVRGQVLSATKLPFLEEGFYVLKDATGEITVVTRGALPAEGKTRIVRGRVETTFKVMGKALGVVVREGG
ncbi:MAG: hypothetical protein ACP5VN_06850 [Acidobacteriota bacterium]